jgi:hypothetical protein
MSSTAKYEKLIDLIINEDQEKAQALFHDIVVETSREIYESLLNEDMTSGLIDEISAEEDGMHGMMEDDEEFIDDEEIDGDYDVDGGDDEQIDTEVSFDGDDMEAEEGEAELEDRVVDLEDKLDELMAEFESMMAGEEGEEEVDMDVDMDDDGEDIDMDAEEEVMEAIELKKVAGLYDSKISSDYADGSKKGPVDANSGAKGMASKPVNFDAGGTATASGTKAPSVSNYGTKGEKEVKDAGKWNNRPGANPAVAKSGKGESVGDAPYSPASKKQGQEVGAGGSVKQDNRSVVPESRRTTKRRI